MKRQIIEIGKQYKDWLVLEKIGLIKKSIYYKCKCLRCGNEYDVRKEHILNKEKSFCCRKCAFSIKKIEPGTVYKNWRVLDEIDIQYYKSGSRMRRFLCECIGCNNLFVVRHSNLTAKNMRFQCQSCANFVDITGQKFGRLTVLDKSHQGKGGKWYFRCKCECGKVKNILGMSLRMGATKSCGCLLLESTTLRFTGENNPNWKGGITDKNTQIRRYIQIEIVPLILKRDRYTCQKCNDNSGNNLNVHHILDFSTYEHMRDIESNLITLCENCHQDFHNNYGYRDTNYIWQFKEWFGKDWKYLPQLLSDYCEPIYI